MMAHKRSLSRNPGWLLDVLILMGVMAVIGFLCATFSHAAPPDTQQPPAQIVLPCEIVDVYDGDTLTARVTCDLRVRLLDCWAPEIHTQNDREKRLGKVSAAALKTLAEHRSAKLIIPLEDSRRLDDLFSFGRILAHVQIAGENATLSQQMVTAGHAWRTKAELQAVLNPRENIKGE